MSGKKNAIDYQGILISQILKCEKDTTLKYGSPMTAVPTLIFLSAITTVIGLRHEPGSHTCSLRSTLPPHPLRSLGLGC